jgi:anti-anti-sigma factor
LAGASENAVVVDELDASLWLVRLLGQLDISNVDQLDSAMKTLVERRTRVLVDLSQVEFIDSSTLHVLAGAHAQLPAKLAVVLPERSAAAIFFAASGYGARLPIYPSRKAALAALSAS